jgi:hypothetical protein
MKFLAILFLAFWLCQCATIHTGPEMTSTDGNYVLSCARDQQVDTARFIAVSCTAENRTERWLNVKAKSFELIDPMQKTTVLSPEQIKDFFVAYKYEQERDDYNTSLAIGAISLTGLVIAGMSGNSQIGAAGLGVGLGALAYDAGEQWNRGLAEVQLGPIYGPDHFLGQGFNIPPKMFVRKHLIIEVENPHTRLGPIKVCLEEPKVECLETPIDKYSKIRKRA